MHLPVAFIDLMIFTGRNRRDVARIAYINVDQVSRTRCDVRLNFVCSLRCAVRRRCHTEKSHCRISCETMWSVKRPSTNLTVHWALMLSFV